MDVKKFLITPNSKLNLSKINTSHTGNFNSKKEEKKNLNPEYPKLNKEQLKGLKRLK